MTLYQSVISGRLLLKSLAACYTAMKWDSEMYLFMLNNRLEHCAKVEGAAISVIAKRIYRNLVSWQCKMGSQRYWTEQDYMCHAVCALTLPVVETLMRTR